MINSKYKYFLENPPGLDEFAGKLGVKHEPYWCNRYSSFSKALRLFQESKGKTILELGTSRSFVGGHLEGCLSPQNSYWNPNNPEGWDWQAGCFTIIAAEFCRDVNPSVDFSTLDISEEHLRRARLMTENIWPHINYIQSPSENFLSSYDGQIDLLYIDTGDPEPNTRALQLREAEIIVSRNLIPKNGTILIDDVYRPTKFRQSNYVSKAEYSIPYYLSNGFELCFCEYQSILIKK